MEVVLLGEWDYLEACLCLLHDVEIRRPLYVADPRLHALLQERQHGVNPGPSSSEHHHVLWSYFGIVLGVVVTRNRIAQLRVTPCLGIETVLPRDIYAIGERRATEIIQGGREGEALGPRVRPLGPHEAPERVPECVQRLVDPHGGAVVREE